MLAMTTQSLVTYCISGTSDDGKNISESKSWHRRDDTNVKPSACARTTNEAAQEAAMIAEHHRH